MDEIIKQISPLQRRLLTFARHRPPRYLSDIFIELMNSPSLKDGNELLHPEWVKIYEHNEDYIKRRIPHELYSSISDFLSKHKEFDIRPFKEKIASKEMTTFLLGAGASKPKPSNIPTVKELQQYLFEKARRLDREDVTKLVDYCKMMKISNIEDLLTAVQLATFCSKNPATLKILTYLLYREDEENYGQDTSYYSDEVESPAYPKTADIASIAFLQDTLQVLFGLLASIMIPAKPNQAHEAIANYSKRFPQTNIITTNYDCCMDTALENVNIYSNYGIELRKNDENLTKKERNVKLLKLHGSLNWYYCDTCQEVQQVEIKDLLDCYEHDKFPFPVIGICKQCGGQRRGLLVPPLAMKFDLAQPLTKLLIEAETAFQQADLIIVIGFSFAEADIYISRMLSKSMQRKKSQELWIVDPDPSIKERVIRKFSASIPDFNDERIVSLPINCNDILPKILQFDNQAIGKKMERKKKK